MFTQLIFVTKILYYIILNIIEMIIKLLNTLTQVRFPISK